MGQRLNIEIKKKDKVLANCYYHWSGYSQTSLDLTKKIIDGFDKYKDENNDVLKAIKLLQETEAGLTREAIHYLYKNIENFDISTGTKGMFGTYDYILVRNRNDGLLEITEEGMEENRKWEEGRITINIDEQTFDFDVLYHAHYEDEVEKYSNYDGELKNIPFNKIDEFIETVNTIIETTNGYFKIGDEAYWLIN